MSCVDHFKNLTTPGLAMVFNNPKWRKILCRYVQNAWTHHLDRLISQDDHDLLQGLHTKYCVGAHNINRFDLNPEHFSRHQRYLISKLLTHFRGQMNDAEIKSMDGFTDSNDEGVVVISRQAAVDIKVAANMVNDYVIDGNNILTPDFHDFSFVSKNRYVNSLNVLFVDIRNRLDEIVRRYL